MLELEPIALAQALTWGGLSFVWGAAAQLGGVTGLQTTLKVIIQRYEIIVVHAGLEILRVG